MKHNFSNPHQELIPSTKYLQKLLQQIISLPNNKQPKHTLQTSTLPHL